MGSFRLQQEPNLRFAKVTDMKLVSSLLCSKILLVSSLLNVQNTEIITRNGINHHHFELSTKRRFCTARVNKKKFLPSS